MAKQTTQTKLPKLFQLPLNPEEGKRSKEAKDRLAMLKIRYKKHSLFEAFEKVLEIAEKADSSK